MSAHITSSHVESSHVSKETVVSYLWAAVRLCIGWEFLWAFLDKAFGLGHETTAAHAWIAGGSPTSGFLSGSVGPFAGIYHAMVGVGLVDWLFMLGLLGVGVTLMFGIGKWIGGITGAVMLVLMWGAVLPTANNLFMDEHLVYAILVIMLALVNADETIGFGRWWNQTALVQRFPLLA
jgi:thiosulfate dehydrogenase (quinone) large subunit